jgi:hypothetical protein
MKTNLIRKLKSAGFTELWRDPKNGQLYTREHAFTVLKSRANEPSTPVTDTGRATEEVMLNDGTA